MNDSDEAQVRRLIADQMRAVSTKDVDGIMRHYAADAILFDVKPPFQTKGTAAWRRTWEECLPYFPASFQIEVRDMRLVVGGELAIAHWLQRFTGMPEGHSAMQTWLRLTAAYRKHRDRWEIVHEHVSVPFDPETSNAVFTLNP